MLNSQCLQNEEMNNKAEVREFVSAFGVPVSASQSSNKNLIKLLCQALKTQDLQLSMLACLEEKSKLADSDNQSHIKIASNFIKIIRACLEQYESQHNVDCRSFRDTT